MLGLQSKCVLALLLLQAAVVLRPVLGTPADDFQAILKEFNTKASRCGNPRPTGGSRLSPTWKSSLPASQDCGQNPNTDCDGRFDQVVIHENG